MFAKKPRKNKISPDAPKAKSPKSLKTAKKVKPSSLKEKKPKAPKSTLKLDDETKKLQKQFNISVAQLDKGLKGIIKFTNENPKLKNNLLADGDFPLYLQVNSIKVPKIHSKIVRIPLKHSVLKDDSEICLIVADRKGIPNKEHEKHLAHYEDLLRTKEVPKIHKVMTFHEFRTEYETFELKKRLVEQYDMFLVEGKISGKCVKKAGKIFYQAKKVPTAVKLQASKLKEHIETTLKKTPIYLHSKGDSFMVQFGHSQMKNEELVANVFAVLQGINKEFPGGFGNIRSLNLHTFRGLTIPIFTTLKNKNLVELPVEVEEPNRSEVSGELSTILNMEVTVQPTGEIVVTKVVDEDEEESEKPRKTARKVTGNKKSPVVPTKKNKQQNNKKAQDKQQKAKKVENKKQKKVVQPAPTKTIKAKAVKVQKEGNSIKEVTNKEVTKTKKIDNKKAKIIQVENKVEKPINKKKRKALTPEVVASNVVVKEKIAKKRKVENTKIVVKDTITEKVVTKVKKAKTNKVAPVKIQKVIKKVKTKKVIEAPKKKKRVSA